MTYGRGADSSIGLYPIFHRIEALTNIFDAHIRAGISGQLFFAMAPADAPNLFRTSFLGRFDTLDPLSISAPGYAGAKYAIREIVG